MPVLVLALVLLLLTSCLLAWSCLRGLNTLKRWALQLDDGDPIIDEMNGHVTWNCLKRSSPWHAPWGLSKPLLLQVLAACSCDAVVLGFAGLRLACNICTPSLSPTLA